MTRFCFLALPIVFSTILSQSFAVQPDSFYDAPGDYDEDGRYLGVWNLYQCHLEEIWERPKLPDIGLSSLLPNQLIYNPKFRSSDNSPVTMPGSVVKSTIRLKSAYDCYKAAVKMAQENQTVPTTLAVVNGANLRQNGSYIKWRFDDKVFDSIIWEAMDSKGYVNAHTPTCENSNQENFEGDLRYHTNCQKVANVPLPINLDRRLRMNPTRVYNCHVYEYLQTNNWKDIRIAYMPLLSHNTLDRPENTVLGHVTRVKSSFECAQKAIELAQANDSNSHEITHPGHFDPLLGLQNERTGSYIAWRLDDSVIPYKDTKGYVNSHTSECSEVTVDNHIGDLRHHKNCDRVTNQ